MYTHISLSKEIVHKGGFSKGGFSNLCVVIISLLLNPPLLNPPLCTPEGHHEACGLAGCEDGAGGEDPGAQRPLRLGVHHAGVEVRRHQAARPLQKARHVVREDVHVHVRAQAPLRVAGPDRHASQQVPLERVVRPEQDSGTYVIYIYILLDILLIVMYYYYYYYYYCY